MKVESLVEEGGAPRRVVGAGTARLAIGGLARAIALAALAAAAVDLLVFGIARASWGVPAGFTALNPASITIAAVAGAVVGGVALYLFVRFTGHAIAVFVASSATVTLLSLGGPLQAMAGAMPGQPAATTATGATMIALHILTAVIIAAVLLSRTRPMRAD